jgi:CheY-like chemotaxis protein
MQRFVTTATETKGPAVAGVPVGFWNRRIAVIKRGGKTVLCIGNDPVHLNLRCSLLTEHGWNVLSSGSGHEGVIRFSQEAVDVVVVDLNHGVVESALITGELKRLRPEVPVIVLVAAENTFADVAPELANVAILKSQEASMLVDALRALLPPE